MGTGCTCLHSWRIVVGRKCPRCGQFHSETVLSGMKKIGVILPRCFRTNMYHTIPRSAYKLWVKRDENRPTQRDATCYPDKVGSSRCALRGASEELVQVEVGHMGLASEGVPVIPYNGWSLHYSYVQTQRIINGVPGMNK